MHEEAPTGRAANKVTTAVVTRGIMSTLAAITKMEKLGPSYLESIQDMGELTSVTVLLPAWKLMAHL
jgi:hypothetical protein